VCKQCCLVACMEKPVVCGLLFVCLDAHVTCVSVFLDMMSGVG
jgi:hypothetical protein